MKIAVPTDFEVLEALSDGKRNTAANLAYEIDRNRSYLNTRLPVLAEHGLLERVGPAPNSGLYEITERGRTAVKLRDRYGEVDDFATLLDEQTNGAV
jgi:DNA-binding HxlR family transcriptional regulator